MPFDKDDIINRPTLEMEKWMKWFDSHLDGTFLRDKAHVALTEDTGYYQAEGYVDTVDSGMLKKIERIYIEYGWEKLEKVIIGARYGTNEVDRTVFRLYYVR